MEIEYLLNKIELIMRKAYKKYKLKKASEKNREILDYCILNEHYRIGEILAERYHKEGTL